MLTNLASFDSAFDEAWPPDEWRDLHVVLAVSGGADSVALLRLALAAKKRAGGNGRLFVAHLNHGIRPVDAAADAAWVMGLCQKLALPCELGSADVSNMAIELGDGLEAAARTARYNFLRDSAERLGARLVAVAHTADDQAETVLQRLLRGTGIAGLAGMQRVRPLSSSVQLIRPLLGMWRVDLLRYLAEIGQEYRTDVTNADRRYTRNRLRHDLLPVLRAEYNLDVDVALCRLAHQSSETQQLITTLAEQLVQRSVTISASRMLVDCRPLAAENPLLVREACKLAWTAAGWPLQNMGFEEWQQLASLIASASCHGNLNLPGGLRAERTAEQVAISKTT
jgi:tRNA(Ile)-lysidine synthase